ncbi:hypothetical protein B2M20_12400 [Nitrobacter vulgaris]|uniref:Terminase n=1 Tax=Nitrobacter vulgaris TaxID=29421 RepID=A0A1V4HXZ8_NITVU|nr:hypothetical protein B2M20_12400 [Nitrobacter vulgaris]
MTLLDAMEDPNLFAGLFPDLESWLAWRAFIAAAFGLPMSAEQLAIYRSCTGRTEPPSQQMRTMVLVVGRRGGKSRILALIAVWLACFVDHSKYLDAGELGVVQVLAADRDQAKVLLRYVKAFLHRVPMLHRMIKRASQVGIELSNSIAIEITTSSYRAVRGRTVVAALCDEIAFWSSENSVNPDQEVINAIKPAMATIPSSMLLIASSPYSRRGVLYRMHKQYHGVDDALTLSWQAPTDVMNPTIDRDFLDQQYSEDAASASAEYGAQFRSDIEAFINREAIEAVTSDEHERPYLSEFQYHAFVDPAGGSGRDSFTLALAHVEGGFSVLDVIREVRPPFSPEATVQMMAELLKAYSIRKIVGDRYAGEWPREQFSKHGITYEPSARPKSQIYSEFLPLLNSKRCLLLDHQKLFSQLVALERRTARGGKDSIDHAPNGHDDVANAAAGVITSMGSRKYRYDCTMAWALPSEPSKDDRSSASEYVSRLLRSRGL